MANYVLVHGAWSGAWSWSEIVPALRAAGHTVHAPTLTGLGERSHLCGRDGLAGLALHVEDVVAEMEWFDLQDVILVGHSYGGMVITGAASRAAERVRALVYVDAFVPADGQSLADLRGPGAQADLEAQAAANNGTIPPIGHAPRDEPTATTIANARRRRPMDAAHFLDKMRLSGAERAVGRRTYIYATLNAPTTFTRFHEALKDDPAWTVHEVPTSHLVMQDDPGGTVRLLLAEAG